MSNKQEFYGATVEEPAVVPASSFKAAFDGLRIGARVPAFWLLAASFAICGMTTNGLIGTHFIPAANDHGMPTTVAAGLLATIGILDVAGTVFSGWLTDRVDPRLLLVVYYSGQQRLARDILRRVMGRWLGREPAVLGLMDGLKQSAAASGPRGTAALLRSGLRSKL